MSDIIDKNIDKLDSIQERFDNIDNKLNHIRNIIHENESLELEEVDLDELPDVTHNDHGFGFTDEFDHTVQLVDEKINDEDFGVKLNILHHKRNEFVLILLESGYKVSFKNELVFIEPARSKFY